MPELSVIVPFCNEYPQVLFTVRNIAEELRERVDFEIITVNNYCHEVKVQGYDQDGSHDALAATVKGNRWLKVLSYDKKLSHWQAKNLAVRESTSKFLWFADAHCMVSRDGLFDMFCYYRKHHDDLHGTLHLPLTYKIMEWHRLIYKLVDNVDRGDVHYSFTRFREAQEPYAVPCMSTCGMMMSRDIYNELGGWPEELGIYGGGENFTNFTLAILGYRIHIWPFGVLYHHGDKRGYSWNYNDYTRNRTIATYMFGGKALAKRFIAQRKGRREVLQSILDDVFTTCADHRALIKSRQKMTIEEWLRRWKTT
ncbi:MAG: glycosyltransferase [Deltaproteobacteria bacterium]|nr:glycosyltransferase [Deltaproteobacteria bacterium]